MKNNGVLKMIVAALVSGFVSFWGGFVLHKAETQMEITTLQQTDAKLTTAIETISKDLSSVREIVARIDERTKDKKGG